MTTVATPGTAESQTTPALGTTPDPAAPAAVVPAAVVVPPVVESAASVTPVPVIPEPITYALKVPDGGKLDPSAVERTTATVAKLGLSNEHAQSVLEHVNGEVAAHEQRLIAEAQHTRTVTWVEQVKADPEIGGANFDATVQSVALAKERYLDAEFAKVLTDTGLGNHPGMMKLFNKIGRSMADGALIAPGPGDGSVERKSTADVMYPDMAKK